MKWLTHSMMIVILVLNQYANAATWIKLHALDNHEININASKIIGFTAPRNKKGSPQRTAHEDTNCILSSAEGKQKGVRETCEEVKHLIKQAKHGA